MKINLSPCDRVVPAWLFRVTLMSVGMLIVPSLLAQRVLRTPGLTSVTCSTERRSTVGRETSITGASSEVRSWAKYPKENRYGRTLGWCGEAANWVTSTCEFKSS